MKLKPLIAALAALLLSIVIDATVPTHKVIVDKIVPEGLTTAVSIVQPFRTSVPAPMAELTAIVEPTPVASVVAPIASPATFTNGVTHEGLMKAVGIAANDYSYVEWTINAESGWNNYAVEPHTGACHLEQSLPCGKDGCLVTDVVCQLTWMNTYVLTRYGSWAAEVVFHKAHNYY